MQEREEKVRTASLLASLLVIVVFCCCRVCDFYIYGDASLSNAFTYSLMHANVMHLACNLWVFLTIVFYSKPTANVLISSYALAVAFGMWYVLSGNCKPVVGMSAYIYCILGRYALTGGTKRNVRYNVYLLLSIGIGYIIPNVSFTAHIACYALGVVYSLLFDKIYKRR